jgi:hypothetical protein
VQYIWVKSARSDDRVALYERDPRHPADAWGRHEVYVAGDGPPVRVAKTERVLERIRAGDLVEVPAPATAEPEVKAAEAPRPAARRG